MHCCFYSLFSIIDISLGFTQIFCTRNLVNYDVHQEPSAHLSGCHLIGKHQHIHVYILHCTNDCNSVEAWCADMQKYRPTATTMLLLSSSTSDFSNNNMQEQEKEDKMMEHEQSEQQC